jgi:hypothetical protein
MSGQIDCMLVKGAGKQVPHTEEYIYNINNVIAVIEVKKTLTKANLEDAISHLTDVTNILPTKDHKINLLRKAYEAILKEPLPKLEDVREIKDFSSLMYHVLCLEAVMPVRIIISYGGYKKESSFRNAFLDIIENKYKDSFAPVVVPSLVTCMDFNLIKFTGMPFAVNSDKNWQFVGSSSSPAIENIIELIWCRLNFYHGVSVDIFGEDLEMPVAAPLMELKYNNESKGWDMTAFPLTEKQLKESRSDKSGEWAPPTLSKEEYLFLNYLAVDPNINPFGKGTIDYIKELGVLPVDLYKGLKSKRIIVVKKKQFMYLTEELALLIHPDGNTYGVDLGEPRGMTWFGKYSVRNKADE